jgi:hypothetical protein
MARRYGKKIPFSKKKELERLNSIIDNHKGSIKNWKKYISIEKEKIRFYEKEIMNDKGIIENAKKEKGMMEYPKRKKLDDSRD